MASGARPKGRSPAELSGKVLGFNVMVEDSIDLLQLGRAEERRFHNAVGDRRTVGHRVPVAHDVPPQLADVGPEL